MRLIVLAAFAIFSVSFITGCKSDIAYIGESYSPTSRVDYFFNKDEIKRPYKTMGKAIVSPGMFEGAADMQHDLKEDACLQGADAIFVEEFRKKKTGESSSWSENGTASQKKKDVNWNSSGSSNTQEQTELEIIVYYLKYTDSSK